MLVTPLGRAHALVALQADVGAAAGDGHVVDGAEGGLPLEADVADGDRVALDGPGLLQRVLDAERAAQLAIGFLAPIERLLRAALQLGGELVVGPNPAGRGTEVAIVIPLRV